MLGLALAALLGLSLQHQPRMVDDSIASPSLHRTMHYRVLLPGVQPSDTLVPALLLLHGFGGNQHDWTELSGIKAIVDSLQLVVVMPDGRNSWYVNGINDTTERYEDAILDDLLPLLYSRYHIDSTRMGVAGLSMGGFGALSLGLRHPHLFRFAGALSASLDVPCGIPDLEKHGRGGLRSSLEHVFGLDTLRWGEHDLTRLAQTVDSASVPYFYLANGIQDEFQNRLLLHRSFADILRARGLHYEYHETEGAHTWDYWGREIQGLVARLMQVLSAVHSRRNVTPP